MPQQAKGMDPGEARKAKKAKRKLPPPRTARQPRSMANATKAAIRAHFSALFVAYYP
jgi:hypothetical protein